MIELHVPEPTWEDEGGEMESRLRTTLSVDGYLMHLEAWEVTYDEDLHIQHLVNEDLDDAPLEYLAAAVNADGSFNTVEIRGRQYILVATPFC